MSDISKVQLPSGDIFDIVDKKSGYITGMEILSYGSSTWQDFIDAYNAKKVVYCRASSNSNPASGSQTRLAFMAYVSNADNPTNVEFQYYRSVSSHTASQQGDQVFVYKLDKTAGWTVTTREASVKIDINSNNEGIETTYSNGVVSIGHANSVTAQTTQAVYPIAYDAQGHITSGGAAVSVPTQASDIGAIASSEKGAASGVVPLDSSSLIDEQYLPSYVDDVVEGYYYEGSFYEDSAHTTPITGETGKIYIDLTESKSYRWSGTVFVEITSGGHIYTAGNGIDISAGDVISVDTDDVQEKLVSGTNIKTINNNSLLGSGNISITNGLQNMVDGSAIGSVRGINTAEESSSYTIGQKAFAEGLLTKASGIVAHAEGDSTEATGNASHAEGVFSRAIGHYSHAEGVYTTAIKDFSHAEGYYSETGGAYAHAQNNHTVAGGKSQTSIGEYNLLDQGATDYTRGNYAFIIGNGTSDNNRSNALTVNWTGDVDIASGAHYKINGTNLSAADVGAQVTLVSGTNIKTINNESILGSGNITISSGTTYTAGTGIDITNNVISVDDTVKNVWYGTSDTDAATVAKVATTSSGDFTLTTGNIVYVKMPNANTATDPTLNVDGTGAKDILRVDYYDIHVPAYFWAAGEIVGFVYNGTKFVILDGGIATTSVYGVTKLSSSTSSTSTTLAATSSAVKAAYDLANGKQDALSVMGVNEGQTGTATTARTLSATALKNIIEYHSSKVAMVSLTIPSSAWVTYSSGIWASIPYDSTMDDLFISEHWLCSPDPSNMQAYCEAGVYLDAYDDSTNSIWFGAMNSLPTSNLTVNIMAIAL